MPHKFRTLRGRVNIPEGKGKAEPSKPVDNIGDVDHPRKRRTGQLLWPEE